MIFFHYILNAQQNILKMAMSTRSELTEKKNSTTHFRLEGPLICHMPKAHIATLIG